MEEPLAEPSLDENNFFHLACSTKENFNLGESTEEGFCKPIKIPYMWPTRGDDESPTQPLAFHLHYVGLGGFGLFGILIRTDSKSPTL